MNMFLVHWYMKAFCSSDKIPHNCNCVGLGLYRNYYENAVNENLTKCTVTDNNTKNPTGCEILKWLLRPIDM